MQYILIATAFITAIAGVFGQTLGDDRRLTAIGWIVIAMATVAAATSVVMQYRATTAKAEIRSVWSGFLDHALRESRTLVSYLASNAKLELESGANEPIWEYQGAAIDAPGPRIEHYTHEQVSYGEEVTRDELYSLLSEFSVHPIRQPRLAWPQAPSWRLPIVPTIDRQIASSASDVIKQLDELVDQYGDQMTPSERAKVEKLRKSDFLYTMATIPETSADARRREDSEYYPLQILEPGIQGASEASFTEFLDLIEWP